MKRLNDKISQAKAKLLVEYPYFGTLASRLTLEVDDTIESFKSDGKKVRYREEYLQELCVEELSFILANGAMHTTLAHDMRKQNRSGWLWQMATDIAINDMLLANGMKMPYGAEYRKRFAGMYAEEIYEELKSDILREDEDLEYEADDSDDVQSQEQPSQTQEELQEEILQEQLLAQEAIQLLETSMQKGEVPKQIERFFQKSGEGILEWQEILRDALDIFMKDDYTLMPPSKKLLSQGIYLPSTYSQTHSLVIAIDSSGSVDDTLLNLFLNEVEYLMEMVPHYKIDILVCDDTIASHHTFSTGEALEVSLKGGGGTDFRPVFSFVDEMLDDVKMVLYFTDLEGIFPQEVPPYEVRWITPKEKEVPFGEVIVLESTQK